MSDMVNGVFVALEQDMREDEVEHLMNTLRMVRGVQDVTTNPSAFATDFVIRSRLKSELSAKLNAIVKEL